MLKLNIAQNYFIILQSLLRMILSARKSYNNNTLFTRLELNLTSLLQNGRFSTVDKGAVVEIAKTRKKQW